MINPPAAQPPRAEPDARVARSAVTAERQPLGSPAHSETPRMPGTPAEITTQTHCETPYSAWFDRIDA